MTPASGCRWHAPDRPCQKEPIATARLEEFKGRVCADGLLRLRVLSEVRGTPLNHRKLAAPKSAAA